MDGLGLQCPGHSLNSTRPPHKKYTVLYSTGLLVTYASLYLRQVTKKPQHHRDKDIYPSTRKQVFPVRVVVQRCNDVTDSVIQEQAWNPDQSRKKAHHISRGFPEALGPFRNPDRGRGEHTRLLLADACPRGA